MTFYRAHVLDTPDDPVRGGRLRADADAGLLVRDGAIAERGTFAGVRGRHPVQAVIELLESCRALQSEIDGSAFTTHLNENPAEVATVRQRFSVDSYLERYDQHGLFTGRRVLVDPVHPATAAVAAVPGLGAPVGIPQPRRKVRRRVARSGAGLAAGGRAAACRGHRGHACEGVRARHLGRLNAGVGGRCR